MIALVLAAPAVVGWHLRMWVPAWMDTWPDGAIGSFDAGWLHSRIEVALPAGTRLRLHGRHLPLIPPAWLTLSGSLDPGDGSEPLMLQGRMGLAGHLYLEASGRNWGAEHSAAMESAGFRLNYSSSPGVSRLDFDGVNLKLGAGPALAFDRAEVSGRWKPGRVGRGMLSVEATALRPGYQPSRVELTIHNLDSVAFAELLAAFNQLQAASPGGLEERLALLALGGAWQAIVNAGLEIESWELILDGEVSIHGHWRNPAAGSRPVIDGRGDVEILLDWLAGGHLLAGFSAAEAEGAARAVLMAAADAGWLTLDPDSREFRLALD